MGIFDFLKKKPKAEPAKPAYVVPATPLVQVGQDPGPKVVQELVQKMAKAYRVSQKGIDFIKAKEGFRKKPYLDSVNIPTIGYGTIEYPDGRKVTLKDEYVTEEQASVWLAAHVAEKCEPVLNTLVKVPLNQNQYDALASFIYNCGVGAFTKSTMLKLINAGNLAGAAAQFPLWSKAGGQTIPGLLQRRKEEMEIFLHDPAKIT